MREPASNRCARLERRRWRAPPRLQTKRADRRFESEHTLAARFQRRPTRRPRSAKKFRTSIQLLHPSDSRMAATGRFYSASTYIEKWPQTPQTGRSRNKAATSTLAISRSVRPTVHPSLIGPNSPASRCCCSRFLARRETRPRRAPRCLRAANAKSETAHGWCNW